jgi:hypothetical protein
MRTIHWASSFVLLGICLAACGGQTSGLGSGSGAGGGSVSGTVAGTTFQVASAVAAIGATSSDTSCAFGSDGGESCVSASNGQTVAVALTNRADATCAYIQSQAGSSTQTTFASLDVLMLAVGSVGGDVTPGTYPVMSMSGPAPSPAVSAVGIAMLETTTPSCASGLNVAATGGTITLTLAGPGEVAGSYDVTFGAQGTFTGSFDVETCALPDAGSHTTFDAGPPVCRQ